MTDGRPVRATPPLHVACDVAGSIIILALTALVVLAMPFARAQQPPCCQKHFRLDEVHNADPRLCAVPEVTTQAIFNDPAADIDDRVRDLVKRMSIREKVGQLMNSAPAVERLGVPAYDYWNECLHGVARAGHATVFPQAIGMAATFDPDLVHTIGDTIATEARAKYYDAVRHGKHQMYYGLNFWSPNINIARDPRWGRAQETYGEDPFLTSRMAVAFITGLQGPDRLHIKALACAKHYAVHSGPEPLRHVFNAQPPEQDLYDTYLPQFEAAVREAHVGAVMGAYNCLYDVPCCASPLLLGQLLRDKWGFDGHVVSDCDAVQDIYKEQKRVPDAEAAAALALKAGLDLNCGNTYDALGQAFLDGKVSEADIDRALCRVLRARFLLGLFDPAGTGPYAGISMSENDSAVHDRLALQAARESIVLLKNDGVLPLNTRKMRMIALIGPNADSAEMLVGNYHGQPSHPVTIAEGIRNLLGDDATVAVAHGCPYALKPGESRSSYARDARQALSVARSSDAIIFVGGLNASLEGEDMQVNYEGFKGGDRTQIELPLVQEDLLAELVATGKPVVFVNCSGAAMAMPWAADHVPAILQAWYPGQEGGAAVAEVLFGKYNPSGRLPVTFYRATSDLPAFDDYAMKGRTYRFFSGKPLWPFGHGLSYTSFHYEHLSQGKPDARSADLILECDITNSGAAAGDEVAQAYVAAVEPAPGSAIQDLCAVKRIHLEPGATQHVKFCIPLSCLRRFDVGVHDYRVAGGAYKMSVGPCSSDLPLSTVVYVDN